jgi:hypothetical protein
MTFVYFHFGLRSITTTGTTTKTATGAIENKITFKAFPASPTGRFMMDQREGERWGVD